MQKPRLLRITTVPISLKLLLRGQLVFMQQQGFEVLAVGSDGPEVASIKEQGIRHQVVNMTRKITPWQDLLSLFALIRIIRKFRPEIVHTHTPKAGLIGMLAAWWCGVPVRMHTVAGLPLMERKGMLRKVLIVVEQITYACATRVYPNSLGLMKFIHENISSRSNKFSIIGRGSSNGIDVKYFSATTELRQSAVALRAEQGISATELVFCFVGRIVGDKGINELVSAFIRLKAELPSRLFLVGDFEDDLDPVSKETRELLVSDPSICLLGYKHDIRPALLASDVFTFPSYREGFPNVVMQACCMEVASIVSDINGCNELIQHEVTGLIVPAKDEDALYRAMRELASDRGRREAFGRRSREFVQANFDQPYLWGELMKEYTRYTRKR